MWAIPLTYPTQSNSVILIAGTEWCAVTTCRSVSTLSFLFQFMTCVPVVSMAAWNSPHADAVRGLQRRVVEIFADLDTHEELKGVHGKDFFVVAQALFLIRYGIQKEPTIAKVETMVKSTQDVPLKARSGADSAFAMLHFMANHPRYRDSLADLTPAMEIPVATVFLLTFQHLPFWLLAELLQQLLTIVRGAKKATSKINAEITTLLNDFIRSVPKLVQLHPDYRSGDKAASVEMTEPLQSKVVAEVELEQFPATAVAEIKPKDVLEDVEGQTEKEESKEVDWRDLMRNAPRKAQRKALARIHDYHEKEATDDRNEKMEEPPDGGFRPAKRTKRSISTDTPDDPVLSAPPASATRTTKRMLDEGNVVYTTRSVRQKTENKPSPSSTPSLTSARPVAVVAPAPAPTASKPVIKGEPSCSSTTPRNEDLPGNIRELSKRPVSSALAAPAIPNDANRASTPPRRQYAKPAKAHLPVLQSAGEDTPCKEPISQHQSSASACYSQPVQIRRSADVDKAQAEVTARTVSKMLYGDSSAKRSPVASTSALRDPRIPSSIVENQYSMSSVESNATAPATSSTFDLRPTSESRQYPHFNRDGKLAQASSSPVKNLPTGLNDRQDIRRLWRETDSYRPEPERHWDRDRRGSGSSELQHHLSLPGRRTSSYSETYRR